MSTIYRYISYTPVVLIVVTFIVSALLVVDWPKQRNTLSCEYFDSINITDGKKQPNSSILHNNILYDASDYAEFDYMINKTGQEVKTDRYIRGCLCKKNNKECIRLCEPLAEMKKRINDTNKNNLLYHKLHNENNDTVLVRLDKKFHILNEQICEAYYKKDYIMNHVIMFKNSIRTNEI